jgi:hypothetical protein
VRHRARIELSGRKTEEVIPAAKKWMATLTDEHDRLEALWLHQSHNVVDEALLKRMLRSSEPRARAAATRVLRYWRDRVPNVLDLLAVQANDEHPRVRLEAVIACSPSEDSKAAAVALECLKHPRDEFLDFGLKGDDDAARSSLKAAVREGRLRCPSDNPAAAEFLLATVTTAGAREAAQDVGRPPGDPDADGASAEARREAPPRWPRRRAPTRSTC